MIKVADAATRFHKIIGSLYAPPIEKTSQLRIGMRAKVLVAPPGADTFLERLWVEVTSTATVTIEGVTRVCYVGKVASEPLNVDLELGDSVEFCPDHVLEWDVPPRGPRIKR